MSDRLTPEREAEIAIRTEAAYPGPWRRSEEGLERTVLSEDDVVAISFGYRGNNTQAEADFVAHAREDVPALLAELNAVRAERDQARTRIAELEAAMATAADDVSDNRRRIYIDGKGNGWISVCHDEGTEWVVPVQPAAHVEQDIRDLADETGSLREIGRCW
jgi:hypothetical protein